MNEEIKEDNTYEMIEIFENVTVIYKNGEKELFNAIHITNKGVFTGRILNRNEFVEGGFIPKQNIKLIKHGTKKQLKKRKHKMLRKSAIFFLFFLKHLL